MNVKSALEILGVDRQAAWTEIRDARRAAIRESHPDMGGSTRRAARINEAFDVLQRETDSGRRPLASPPIADASAPLRATAVASPPTVASPDSPTELLLRLAEVGHDVGEVVFVDPLSGLLEIVVGTGPGVGQLTVAVGGRTDDGVNVEFTLEPLGVASPPPIGDVVADLLRRHRAQPRF